jgi:hypothetical protein
MLGVMEVSTAATEVDRGDADPAGAGERGSDAPSDAQRDWRRPSVQGVILLLLLLVAVRVGLQPLHDNSFLTHLSTGRLIFARHSVPGTDPYSWTAHGHLWTVQSWGASVIYAGLEKSFLGLTGIRIFDAFLTVSLVLVLWRLTRPAKGLLARIIPMGIVVCMGTGLWVERPLLIGALALALVMLAAEGGLDPRWLVPVMWIWVNTHGSFPFGVGLLVLLVIGRWIDERTRPVVELRALGWATVGTLVGAINPIGPKMLLFPIELLSNREAFKHVAEWEPPHFHRGVELFFAFQLVAVLALLLTRHRKARAILPVVVFGAMALMSTRNILQASIVLTPILAIAASGLGQIDGRNRPRLLRPVALAVALLLGLVTLSGVLIERDTALGAYPESAATYMRSHHLLGADSRVISTDYAGNWLEYRYHAKVPVFIDDRVDMFPLRVIRDYMVLLDGGHYQRVLDRYHPTVVLWHAKSQFGKWLLKSPRWHVVHRDKTWLVAVPVAAL